MNLLAVKRQYDIVIRALQVLENNFQNDDWVSLYKDEQCGIVLSLSMLLLAKQGSMAREQVCLGISSCNCIQSKTHPAFIVVYCPYKIHDHTQKDVLC